MSIPEIFIRRPVATTLVMIGILLFGVAGYRESARERPAECRLSDDQCACDSARSKFRHDGRGSRAASGETVLCNCGTGFHVVAECSGHDQHHAAIQSQAQHRWSRSGRAERHHAGRRSNCPPTCRPRPRSARSTLPTSRYSTFRFVGDAAACPRSMNTPKL